jgi:hypothetical protein
MKIKDIIVDTMMNTRLFEMAFDRQTAKNKVIDLSPQIFDHLLKIWVLDIPQSSQHWRREIDAWLGQIDKIYLKLSKRKPPAKDLYDWLIFDSAPHYSEEYIDKTIGKWSRGNYKGVNVREYDASVVLNQILSVIDKVCTDISKDNYVTIDEYLGDKE